MTAILFVCMGNICRSPLAEGAFRHALKGAADLAGHIDSAGTISFHAGKAPDARGQRAARAAGFDISAQRARQVRPSDFDDFDLILAMDGENLADLKRMAPEGSRAELRLFLDFAPNIGLDEMPDPYYGSEGDFHFVRDAALEAAAGLVDHLKTQQQQRLAP